MSHSNNKTTHREILQDPTPEFPSIVIVRDAYTNGDTYEGEMHIVTTTTTSTTTQQQKRAAGNDGLVLVKSGYGVYRFHNGAVYSGEWVEGKMHGWGVFEEPVNPSEEGPPPRPGGASSPSASAMIHAATHRGDRYEGYWVKGRRSFGVYSFGATGDMYQGRFIENNLKHGRSIVWEDHTMYEATYDRDVLVAKVPFDASFPGEEAPDAGDADGKQKARQAAFQAPPPPLGTTDTLEPQPSPARKQHQQQHHRDDRTATSTNYEEPRLTRASVNNNNNNADFLPPPPPPDQPIESRYRQSSRSPPPASRHQQHYHRDPTLEPVAAEDIVTASGSYRHHNHNHAASGSSSSRQPQPRERQSIPQPTMRSFTTAATDSRHHHHHPDGYEEGEDLVDENNDVMQDRRPLHPSAQHQRHSHRDGDRRPTHHHRHRDEGEDEEGAEEEEEGQGERRRRRKSSSNKRRTVSPHDAEEREPEEEGARRSGGGHHRGSRQPTPRAGSSRSRAPYVSVEEYEAAVEFLKLQELHRPNARSPYKIRGTQKVAPSATTKTKAAAKKTKQQNKKDPLDFGKGSPRRLDYVGQREDEVRAKFRFFQ